MKTQSLTPAACALATLLAMPLSSGSAAQFTKVIGVGITNETAYSWGCAWGDYDNDGYSDLIVVNTTASEGPYKRFLYRNNRDGTFTRKTATEVGPVAGDAYRSFGCAWADFNNDGFLDLAVDSTKGTTAQGLLGTTLYLNHGNGTFGLAQAGDLTTTLHGGGMHCWADYDGDGFLDVFVATGYRPWHLTNMLFHARGDGTFERVWQGPIVTDWVEENNASWVDYSNDGRPDLFLAVTPFSTSFTADRLYRNDGQGKFTSIDNALTQAGGTSANLAWGDYDNDGDLDVVVSYRKSDSDQGTRLFRNDGDDAFTLVRTWPGKFGQPMWVDYNNDGYLDLYDVHGQNGALRNILYHNNRDGTFTVVSDAVTADLGNWICQAWGDYDNDGFMDVFVTDQYGRNALYHNLGNTNHWIKFKLVGTASNRSAIGAKVRVLATIGGKSFWQMREVSSGGWSSQDDLRPNFGLGDATNVELVRVEWPSGNVQEVTNTAPDQVVAITEQTFITPVRPTGSLGSTVALTSQRSGTWQWYHEGLALDGQTNRNLSVTNLTTADAGRYSVVVDTGSGVFTNYAYLFVDTQFIKITEGPLVNDLGDCDFETVAGDYDSDGFDDLFVLRYKRGLTTLYHNNQNGTFTATSGPPSQSAVDDWAGGAWGDFDNDGNLDLVAMRVGKPGFIYWNNGSGTFSSSSFDPLSPWNVAVADYDRDGLLDLYFSYLYTANRLYHNSGDRTFRRMLAAEVGPPASASTFGGVTWADYDDDGWPDLCAPHHQGGRVYMYHNEGNGRFTSVSNLVTQQGSGLACAWGDCDNDGKLDLFIASLSGANRLYLNAGGGSFKSGTLGFGDSCNGASWADYDNDGFLDLFVSSGNKKLYHNNGDGTFTKITSGSIVTDRPLGSPSAGSYWGTWFDYDNNGFLDLYVVNGDDYATVDTRNFLYRNNGNSNAWLKVKLIGTTSNRDAVGAKVRVQATYAGKSRWQRRDITGGDAINGAQSYAHFGLGNATRVPLLRIEWPSGTVQELTNVATSQVLTVIEPRRPVLGVAVTPTQVTGTLTADPSQTYRIDVSDDLAVGWMALTNTLTDANGKGSWSDPGPAPQGRRFYKALKTP